MAVSVIFPRYLKTFYIKIPRIKAYYIHIMSRPQSTHAANLWERYEKTKSSAYGQKSLKDDIDFNAIFANNETDLEEIDVYGFDYDYTLASYKESLHYLLYNLGKNALVNKSKYPKDLLSTGFDPEFAVRGLHFDVQKGLLLKIDAFHNIQLGAVYRGLTPVSDEEVVSLYGGTHVPIDKMSFHGTSQHMHQLMDMFALPEMTLLANVIEHFVNNNISFDPEYVFHDVRNAVQGVHKSGELHQEVMDNVEQYIEKGPEVSQLLNKLSSQNKKLFLITNSGLPFVDKGMSYMLGSDWTDLFDVIVTNARKPKFYSEHTRPFRTYDRRSQHQFWDCRVNNFKKGQIYQEGNLLKLQEMTNWYGYKVLYIGDHVYSDLADPTLKLGWRTGAIIPELEAEIKTINSETFRKSVTWQQSLQGLIEKMQVHEDEQSKAIIAKWMDERNELRRITKTIFNPQFGSLFRTYHNPTYFTRRLSRFADIYMSSVVNLSKYSLSHTFYPRRAALPHEAIIYTE